MSTAVYPLGMRSTPSSGYNHQSTYNNKQYSSWKGTGINSFPVGTASGHIRPLTNNDSGNVFQTGFGLARPLKHYRKGRFIPPSPITDVNNPAEETSNETALINYNINRFVKSSTSIALGGSSSSSGLLNDMMSSAGAYTIHQNVPGEINGTVQMNSNCKTCEGIAVVASYKPNITNLLENPEVNSTTCCNQERFAKQRVIYASTNIKKNYYTTTKQYLQNRCKTFEQKSFNFVSNAPNNSSYYKPGSPLATSNTYLANCQVNTQLYEGTELAFINKMLAIMLNEQIITQTEITAFNETEIYSLQGFFDWILSLPEIQKQKAVVIFEVFVSNPYSGMPVSGPTNPSGCQLAVYKPNNYQFAKQGAVSSSTRLLKLNVDTISTNAASLQNYNNTGQFLVTANQLYAGDANNYTNLLKNKSPNCYTNLPLNFYQSGPYQNKKMCYFQKQLPEYQSS